jgi:hypothetical protein
MECLCNESFVSSNTGSSSETDILESCPGWSALVSKLHTKAKFEVVVKSMKTAKKIRMERISKCRIQKNTL